MNPSCWCACWSIPLCLSAMAGLEHYRELYQPQLRWYDLSLRYLCIHKLYILIGCHLETDCAWTYFICKSVLMYAISICITRINKQYKHGFVAWFVSPFIWEHGWLHISPEGSRPRGVWWILNHNFPSISIPATACLAQSIASFAVTLHQSLLTEVRANHWASTDGECFVKGIGLMENHIAWSFARWDNA